jgi:integrase
MLTTYNRPSEPLAVRRKELNRPMAQVSQDWTVLLWPEERDARSKVLGSDDSLSLSSRIIPWFTGLVEAMSDGPQNDRIFNFSYAEFTKEFTKARRKLRIKKLVPYQCRHSGASIDLCNNHRSIAEVKARGRWGSEKSMMRYNRAAKLAQSMKGFDRRQLDFFMAAEKQLEALFFGRVLPESLPLP